MHRQQLDDLPTTLDVATAAQLLGIGRSLAYDLVRHDQWPTPVVHVGRLIKIPTAPLLRLLDSGTTDTHPQPA